MKKKTYIYRGKKVSITKEEYRNNGTLALMLHYEDGETEVITVNLNDPGQSDSLVYLDTNNCEKIESFIEGNHLGFSTGITTRSGFCQYPLYNINRDAL